MAVGGSMKAVGRLAGRAALGVPFVLLGMDTLREPGRRAATVAQSGLPLPIEPETAVRINGTAMMAGGTALALGILPRAAAAGLLAALIPTTYAGHRFWRIEDPTARAQQRTQFLKNIAIAGGLLLVATREPRP
jgi:uncharacterized membrane protein YphA (DoxX/SURF4 family)